MSEHTQTTGRRQRQRDEARDFLKTLQATNPEANRTALIELYLDHVRSLLSDIDDPAAVEALVIAPLREWIGANIAEPSPRRDPSERAAAKAAKAAVVAEIAARDNRRIDAIVTRHLLEWEMIDGRKMGDLTGSECRKLSERYGVFFHVISDAIPARARVRNHYSELELQALAHHHNLIVQ